MKNAALFVTLGIATACSSANLRQTHEASGQKIAVSTQGEAATRAAIWASENGGNLVDAAVAASFTVSVERPQSTGLGGGGFFLYREGRTGKVYAVDFRERAPYKKVEPQSAQDLKEGILAVATPGLVAGLLEVHQRFGKLSLAQVLAPAIELAEKGFPVYPHLARRLEEEKAVLAKYSDSRKIFLKADGTPYKKGEILIQKDLAQTLRLIAKEGKKAFYSGAIAKAILDESKNWGGALSAEDFKKYKVKWRTPLKSDFLGNTIYTFPPPSSGGTHVLQILNILEKDSLATRGYGSVPNIHLFAAASQQAFADRAKFMGDPDFVTVPVEKLISKKYASEVRKRISLDRARPADEVQAGLEPKNESTETTHISLINSEGDMIATTQTVNGYFGSGIVAQGTGIVLNNEMDDFAFQVGATNLFGAVGGERNLIEPGKTPLSSMAPTLVVRDSRPLLSLGAPGGTRIITCVAQTLLRYFEYGMPLYESIERPRIHHQWKPDVLKLESPGPDSAVLEGLQRMGYKTQISKDAVPCHVMAVAKEGAELHAVSDPRDAGIALGY